MVLQGYNLVSYNAAISMAQSVFDAVGTALILQWPRAWYSGTLTGVGIVSVINAAAACMAGLLAAMQRPERLSAFADEHLQGRPAARIMLSVPARASCPCRRCR